MSSAVRIPADVDRPDRLIANLTARQVAILAGTALVLYTIWTLTRTLVPLPVFLLAAAPVGVTAAVLALGQRDGVTLDRLLLAAIAHHLTPACRVAAADSIGPAPDWLTARATPSDRSPVGRGDRLVRLRLPAETVTDTGVVDLGTDGLAVVAVASTVNFALRTPAEQDSLVGGFGRYLHSLTAPVQVLVRTERLDLSAQITDLRDRAGSLAHPALETAALDHADYLTDLAAQTDLQRRQVLLVLREPLGSAGPVAGRETRWWGWGRESPQRAHAAAAARRATEARLVRRLAEAANLLAPAGIVITPLDAGQTTAVLTAACAPDTLLPPSTALAGTDEVITTWPSQPAPRWGVDEPPGTGDRLTPHPARRCGDLGDGHDRAQDTAAGTDNGAFVPDSVRVGARHLEVGTEWVASFAVTGYPREVHPGWLAPLLTYPGRLDVSVHVEPIDPSTAAARLQRQLARLESGRRHTAEHGRLADPQVDTATEDAYDLSVRLARGEGKLFRVGLYLTVHARTEDGLAEETAALRALAASLLLDAKPATYRALQGWVCTLPMGLDQLGLRRTFDTAALSAAFPFTSPDLPPADPASLTAPAGVLYGANLGSPALVHWDRFGCDNHNAVILGRSGAGKSYLVKLELLRSLYRGIEIAVIDPEDEYTRLAAAVGATSVRLGAPGVRLNPFDLPLAHTPDGRRTAPSDALIRRSLFLHTVLAVLLGADPTPDERAVLDHAIAATYQQAGITTDPRSWTRPAPTLRDLRTVLSDAKDPASADLAARLHPWVDGSFAALLDGPTTTHPEGHLVVFSLRELPEELKPLGTLLTLDTIWRRVSNPAIRRPRLVVVDEAWLLMHQPAGAQFLFRMAKAARKHWAGLTVATQDSADVLGTDIGKAVVANAATQILLRQAPQAIDEITRTFDLSDGERQFLLSADRGQGLLCAGTHRVAFQTLASPTEHDLITTDPAELTHHTTAPPSGHGDQAETYLDLDAHPDDETDGVHAARW